MEVVLYRGSIDTTNEGTPTNDPICLPVARETLQTLQHYSGYFGVLICSSRQSIQSQEPQSIPGRISFRLVTKYWLCRLEIAIFEMKLEKGITNRVSKSPMECYDIAK